MTLVAAHRGLSAEEPENTFPAFHAAAEAGFPCFELDVRLTHDGEVVVIHDASIARTTDGAGRVADMDYDELCGYDTGVGPIPRLDDLLVEMAGWKGLWNIELKTHRAAEPVVDLLHHHGVAERALLTAMDPHALQTAAEHRPEVTRGLITLGPPDLDDMDVATELACDWVNVDHDFLKPGVFAMLKEKGFKVGAWTVNDVDEAVRLADLGVDCLITDRREVLAAVPGIDRGL